MNELLAHYGRKMAHVVNMYKRELPGYHVNQEIGQEEGEQILATAIESKQKKKKSEDLNKTKED